MFSLITYMVTVVSIIGTLCVSTPIEKSKAEKTQLQNVWTAPEQKYYKPVYIDIPTEEIIVTPNTHLPVKKTSNYPK